MSRAFDHHGVCDPIEEPTPWPYDETKRVPVIDPNDGRVIRYVGWRKCMACPKFFFSPDVRGVRLCEKCKATKSEGIID
jgi:hypothetical protein